MAWILCQLDNSIKDSREAIQLLEEQSIFRFDLERACTVTKSHFHPFVIEGACQQWAIL